MADDPDRDLIPVKDVKGPYFPQSGVSVEGGDVLAPEHSTLLERKIAEQLSRNHLEDQLYRLRDENLELKKLSRKQEDQLKKLSTKMSRLLTEKKKLEMNSSPGRKRDIEMEEAIEELHDKVRTLEKNNIHLREKLLVAKQQVISQARRPNPYPHVQPKVNSGRPRSGVSTYVGSAFARGASIQSQRGVSHGPLPSYVMQLLDEARNELFNLKELVSTQKNEIDMYEQEVEILKDRLRMKDIEFEEEINILKSQITEGKRQHVQENLDLIRLHRELKQKNSKMLSLQSHIADMEERLKAQKASYDRLVKEVEEKTLQMQEEQNKSLELFTELQKSKAALLSLADLQENLKSVKKENEVLKETNDKLINSVLSQEKERASQSNEQILRDQITHMDASLKAEMKDKEALQDEIRAEKEKYRQLSEEHKQLQNNLTEVKNQVADLEAKLDILKSEEVDFEELGEALALVKLKKQQSINMSFMGDSAETGSEVDLKAKLEKAERDHAETVKELHSVREMLMTQYRINKDAQEEVKSLTEKLVQQEKEYQTKLEEYANLLDLRASRIQKLEKQLNDIAYGTKKFKIKDYKDDVNPNETLDLNRGENVFEITVKKFVYSKDGLACLRNSNPSSFLTWNFYEFQLQSTPVVKGSKPNFECTSQYRVKVDDFFLFYLHKNPVTMELHESLGADYRTLAACQLNFGEVLEQPHGRLHGMQEVTSVCESAKGIVFGTLHYWVRFKVPIEESFRLYKERFKALKYIQSNDRAATSAAQLLNQPHKKNPSMNELHVKLVRCVNLKGKNKDVQPSPFCIYKFYDLPDQDTMIVPFSNNPEFSDHRTFPFCIDIEFQNYLRTKNLEIYVFDDNDPDVASYIGRASVPLLPLSQGKHVKGIFQLQKDGQGDCGTIEVSLYWQDPYQSLSTEVTLPAHLEKPIEYPEHLGPVTVMESEIEDSLTTDDPEEKFDYSKKVVPVPKPRKRTSLSKPVMTSTPIKTLSSHNSPSNSNSSRSHSTLSSPHHVVPEENKSVDIMPKPAVRRSKLPQPSLETENIQPQEKGSPSLSSEQSESPVKREDEREETLTACAQQANQLADEDTVPDVKHEISFEEMSDVDDQSELSSSSEEDLKTTIVNTVPVVESHAIPSITVGIWQLSLLPESSVLNDPNIHALYVEFRFLDYPLEEMETPVSFPKPIPPDVITFNYKKTFRFEPKANRDKYQLLTEMFNPDMPEASWIKFTVVNEPPGDEEDMECEDVGYAYVDLREILHHETDITEEDIIIYDAKDSETEVGRLNVTVEALSVLKLIQGIT